MTVACGTRRMSDAFALCPKCKQPMRLVRVVPALAGHPELQSFKCRACGEVTTRPVEDVERPR